MEETVKPDEVQQSVEGGDTEEDSPVSQPTKLIRIASMTRAMLEEVRQAPLDENGRARLAEVHGRSLDELREVLSPDLRDEFDEVMIPLGETNVSGDELRIAQAQLIGWLEGLFHGIQASLWTQLAEMQKRAALPKGAGEDASGLYL
jgi:hypothetical protein